MYAAAEKLTNYLSRKIVLWEIFLLPVIKGDLKVSTMKSGIEYMTF
jgi:hypothetical protein